MYTMVPQVSIEHLLMGSRIDGIQMVGHAKTDTPIMHTETLISSFQWNYKEWRGSEDRVCRLDWVRKSPSSNPPECIFMELEAILSINRLREILTSRTA